VTRSCKAQIGTNSKTVLQKQTKKPKISLRLANRTGALSANDATPIFSLGQRPRNQVRFGKKSAEGAVQCLGRLITQVNNLSRAFSARENEIQTTWGAAPGWN